MRTIPRRSTLVVITLSCVLGLAVGPAWAQDEEESSPVDELNRQEVETLAAAFLEVNAIQQDLQARLEQAENPDEARSLQQLANDQILAALDDHGVTPEEYTEAMNATQENTEFRERFIAAVNRVQGEEPEGGDGR